jgi:hypothetical protein
VELDAGHAFRFRTAQDMFRKLHREKRRFEQTEADRRDQVDAALNFCVTAWHLTDWVWGIHERAVRTASGARSLGRFQEWIGKQCPELAVCDVIANAIKHGGYALPLPRRPMVETVLVARPKADGSPVRLVTSGASWTLRVTIDGRSTLMLVLMNRVFSFWHGFIQDHCVQR